MSTPRRDRQLARFRSQATSGEVQPWIALITERTSSGYTVIVNGRATPRQAVPANDLAFAGGSIGVGSEVVIIGSDSGQDTPTILGLSSWSVHGG